MARRTVAVLCYLLSPACIFAIQDSQSPQPSFDYEVARTHEIEPHRRTVPLDGVSDGENQFHIKLVVSPSGDVTSANADGDGDIMKFWPRLQQEVLAWKFTPFEENGRAVQAEVEEYIDLVPPERLPKTHIAPPQLRRRSRIEITLERSGCFGSCPSYKVTLTNNRVLFDGGGNVVASGQHSERVSPEKVRDLVRKFIAADFYSMDASYQANVTDNPGYSLCIDIDGHKKNVDDYVGQWVGMPAVIADLEEQVDKLAQTERWIEGGDGLVDALRAEKFNFKSYEAQAILKQAAQRGQSTTVAELLDAGVPLATIAPPKSKSGDSDLADIGFLDSASNNLEALKSLIDAGASEDDQRDKDLALASAARAGNLESAKALIAYGADPNADLSKLTVTESGGGMTMQGPGEGSILIYAANSGNPDIVREILKYDPDVNARGRKGQTALFSAGEYRYKDKEGARVEIVRLLVAAVADVNARDDEGNTPLHKTFLTDVEEELLKLGADVNARNNDGETPIFTTVDDKAIPIFIAHGADLSIRNNKGQTVIEAAEEKGPQRQQVLRETIAKLNQHN